MAKIIDPDDLNRDIEVYLDPTTTPPLVGLEPDTGNLDDGGVSLQALYSFCKEQWKSQADLIKYPFPMVAITPEQFEFVDDWVPSGSATINLFRDAGFATTSAGTSTSEYIGVISLGDVDESQVYYSQESGTTAVTVNIVLTGTVNQAIQVYGDTDNGDFDYRSFFTVYAREQARLYDQANHTDIGVSTFTYQAYRFPLSTAVDLKVTQADVDADNSGVTIQYYTEGQARTIGTSDYDFDVIIDGNGIPKQNIYEAVQSFLRKTTDIDAGAGIVSGKTADLLLTFVGDTLLTSTGVYIDNFAVADTNALQFTETGGTVQTFPYVAAGSIGFNDNLYTDGLAIYRGFFTNNDAGDNDGSDYGTASAILIRQNELVENSSNVSFSGQSDGNYISGNTSQDITGFTNLNSMIEVSGGTNAGFWTVTGISENALYVKETLTEAAEGTEVDLFKIIGGDISASTSASFSYDYDNNSQRGAASSGTTVPATIVAIGLDAAQYVKSTGNITRITSNTFALVAALERNYSNPA